MKTKLLLATTSSFIVFMVMPLSAGVITPLLTTDAGSTTSSTSTEQDASRTINAALDGSGLTATLTDANVLTVTHENAASASDHHWLTSGGEAVNTEVTVFDLGGAFNVTDIYLWQYNRSQFNRGIREFDIRFDTGSGFSGAGVSMNSLGISDFIIGTTAGVDPAQHRTFTATQNNVQRIEFSNYTNFGDVRIGLPEIRFGGTAVPEASSLGLIGLAGLFMLRRRRA